MPSQPRRAELVAGCAVPSPARAGARGSRQSSKSAGERALIRRLAALLGCLPLPGEQLVDAVRRVIGDARNDGYPFALLAVKNVGGESQIAWRGVLDDLTRRGLKAPELANY